MATPPPLQRPVTAATPPSLHRSHSNSPTPAKFSASLQRLNLSPTPTLPPPGTPRSHADSVSHHAWSGVVDPKNLGNLASPGSNPNAIHLAPNHLPMTNEQGDLAARLQMLIRYGDKIRLFSRSRYLKDDSTHPGGYAGYYFRSRKGVKGEEGYIVTGKEMQLAILSPAGPDKDNL